jgi:hypothetical protein
MFYKTVFALASQLHLELIHMDIKTAFLNGILEETIFVEQPAGFADGTSKVCKLNRALYGLKHAPRIWNQILSTFIQEQKFIHTSADFSLFVNSKDTIVAVYVDDLLLAGSDQKDIVTLKNSLSLRFKMTDLGPCSFYLGLEVIRDKLAKTLYLSQRVYLEQVLNTFGLFDVNPVASPMDPGLELVKSDPDHEVNSQVVRRYQSANGSFMYAMLGTRPNLGFAVGKFCQFAAKPNESHFVVLKSVFRFVRGTLDLVLKYFPNTTQPLNLQWYSDTDWAEDKIDQRSTGGYLFYINNCLISWSSKKQPTVALSSYEAEYMALAQAAKETIWLRLLLSEIGHPQPDGIVISKDNKSAIALVHSPAFHAQVKHIDIQHHFIKQKKKKKKK